jgi:hypothetical protein
MYPVLAAVATYEVVGAGAFVLALALALLGLRLKRRRRDGRRELPAARPPPPGAMVCPACGREQPAGTLFCPADARRLVGADGAPERRGSLHCPRCRRAFDPGTRFCPFDAEELAQWPSAHEHGHDHGDEGGIGKICPVCAAKYGIEATFCGRDGTELMTVN